MAQSPLHLPVSFPIFSVIVFLPLQIVPMIVMKFGGTSNRDAASMSNVIRIVSAHLSHRPVVVISAIAQATNELEKSARAASAGDVAGATVFVDRLMERHNDILTHLLSDPDRIAGLRTVLEAHRKELVNLIQGVGILKELTAKTMDAFCSHGERLSSRIVAAGLQEAGVESVWIDAKDFMLTDDNFGRALPLMKIVVEKVEQVLRPPLEKGIVPVTQGFIGVTRSGAYTTMGRESSDFSASIIGAAMNAQRVQIWTDVDGILTADPRVIPDVRKIKRMSYEEAFELSYFGAKVLHPNTMLPLLEKNIPVEIRNSRKEGGTGTVVDLPAPSADALPMVTSIACKEDMTVFVISPRTRLNQYLFWEGILSVLNRAGCAAGSISTSEYSMALAIDGNADIEGLRLQLEEHGRVTVVPGQGSICIVGKGLRGSSGVLDRIFAALNDAKVTMISFGASGLNVTVVLAAADVETALRRLHGEFFGSHGASDAFETPIN
jgi:aspartate kinase